MRAIPKGRGGKTTKRTKEQKEADAVIETNLFLKGYSYRVIADEVNKAGRLEGRDFDISHVQVYKDCNAFLVEWKKQRLDNIDLYITKSLRTLDEIEKEAWEAWQRSKSTRSKVKVSGSREKAADGLKSKLKLENVERTKETLIGEARFLDIVLDVQQRKAKLLGFDTPVKIEVKNENIGMNTNVNYVLDKLPDEILSSFADSLQDKAFEMIKQQKQNGGN